jgi:hypothetical protein
MDRGIDPSHRSLGLNAFILRRTPKRLHRINTRRTREAPDLLEDSQVQCRESDVVLLRAQKLLQFLLPASHLRDPNLDRGSVHDSQACFLAPFGLGRLSNCFSLG